jgi:ubiquinone/menaquinone biosynthesis C-methylase UbiE
VTGIRAEPDSEEYHSRWSEAYQGLNYSDSLSSRAIRASHTLLETPFGPTRHFPRVLEVGCGGGQHFDFVRHTFDRYLMTDSSEEMLAIARTRLPENRASGVEFSRADAAQLAFPDGAFDRLVAAHVLEHLERPHEVLREWARVVKPGGVISILLPSDPGLAWRVGRSLGPRRRAREAGIDYDYWMAREHINSINALVSLIEYYFAERRVAWWPWGFQSMDLNLFYSCHATI